VPEYLTKIAREVPLESHPVRPTVLIVDDEVDTCELLAEFCQAHDLRCVTATDGAVAVAALTREPGRFGIVISDLHLPGADGFEVLRAARASTPGCYGVIITGFGTIDTAVRAVREGAYDYLTKPFALGQLEVVLRRILDRMALEYENEVLARELESGPPAASREVTLRLASIDSRLSQIEAFLRRA